ncbi:hypothetical protein SynA1544_02769 [Synechococcus sp. A15-44]|nr:hypothetical protein SynA1544_02769 [Synechococcus sp. A15-44]
MELLPSMLFCLASLALIDSSEQSGETSVDCDAFVGSSGVAAGSLIVRPIVV